MAKLNDEVVGLTSKDLKKEARDDMFGRIPEDGDVKDDKMDLSFDGEDALAFGDITSSTSGGEVVLKPVIGEGCGSGGGDEEKEEERSSGVDVQSMNLTPEERIGYMEVQLGALKLEVEQIKSRMTDVINTQNGMLDDRAVAEGRSVVPMAAFTKMVDSAVASGTKYGVSRRYITRYLCEEHGQIDGRYFQKKLGIVLKKKMAANEYLLSDSLFRVNKK